MNCWQILDIQPTSDEREIRRAYAKKLKVTRPDEDAAAYQQLREAFDEALRLAPYQCSEPEEEIEFNWEDEVEGAENTIENATESAVENSEISHRSSEFTLEQIVAQMVKGYQQDVCEFCYDLNVYFEHLEKHSKEQAIETFVQFLRDQDVDMPTIWAEFAERYDLQNHPEYLREEEFDALQMHQFYAHAKKDFAQLERHLMRILYNANAASYIHRFGYYFQFEIPLLNAKQHNRLRQNIAIILKKSPHAVPESLRDHWFDKFNFSPAIFEAQPKDKMAIRTPEQLIRICERLFLSSEKAFSRQWQRLRSYAHRFDFNSQRNLQRYFRFALEYRPLSEELRDELQSFVDQVQEKLITENLEKTENTYLSADDVIHYLEQLYREHGDTSLQLGWQKTLQLLTALPLEQTEEISWKCYYFLKNNDVQLPEVWAQFSHYFNWHGDYHFANRLGIEEVELLQERIEFAKQTENNIKNARRYPILGRIRQGLQQSVWRKFLTYLYALLIYPLMCSELPENKRTQTLGLSSDLDYFYQKIRSIRIVFGLYTWLFGGIFALHFRWIKPEDGGEIERLLVQVAAIFLLLGLVGAGLIRVTNFFTKFFKLFQSKIYTFSVGFLLPILLLFNLIPEIKFMAILSLFPLTAFVKQADKLYFATILSSLGLVAMAPWLQSLGLPVGGIMQVIILWININLATKMLFNSTWQWFMEQMHKPFIYDGKEPIWRVILERNPLRALVSAILWLTFLPNLAAKYFSQTQSLVLLHEFALGAMLLLLPFGYSETSLAFFYPAVLATYLIQRLVKVIFDKLL